MEAVTIKKYPNRRLYHTGSRKYVNLDDIAAAIREGKDVQVLDARTGQDITRQILTQIVAEDARAEPGLPLELLRQLIVASDRAGQEFINWYLKSAFETYQRVQDTVQDRLTDLRSAALSPLHAVRNMLSPAADRGEIEQLRNRVAELEKRLESPRRRTRGPAGGV